MFKLKDQTALRDMGFKKDDNGDYVVRKSIEGSMRTIFTIYMGSDYIRFPRTSYIAQEALHCIHEWTKKDYIEWED